jgi:hypothetical protein
MNDKASECCGSARSTSTDTQSLIQTFRGWRQFLVKETDEADMCGSKQMAQQELLFALS